MHLKKAECSPKSLASLGLAHDLLVLNPQMTISESAENWDSVLAHLFSLPHSGRFTEERKNLGDRRGGGGG